MDPWPACVVEANIVEISRTLCGLKDVGFDRDHYCMAPLQPPHRIHRCACGHRFQADGGWVDLFIEDLLHDCLRPGR